MVENLSKTITSLIDIHGDYLFNYALLRVSRREIAEDMVQETYTAACEIQKSNRLLIKSQAKDSPILRSFRSLLFQEFPHTN